MVLGKVHLGKQSNWGNDIDRLKMDSYDQDEIDGHDSTQGIPRGGGPRNHRWKHPRGSKEIQTQDSDQPRERLGHMVA